MPQLGQRFASGEQSREPILRRLPRKAPAIGMSVTRDMSGACSKRSVWFLNRSEAGGDDETDRVAARGDKVDPDRPTQRGRALAQLGIAHIAALFAASPRPIRAHVRRAQDRLPKELGLG